MDILHENLAISRGAPQIDLYAVLPSRTVTSVENGIRRFKEADIVHRSERLSVLYHRHGALHECRYLGESRHTGVHDHFSLERNYHFALSSDGERELHRLLDENPSLIAETSEGFYLDVCPGWCSKLIRPLTGIVMDGNASWGASLKVSAGLKFEEFTLRVKKEKS